MTSLRRLKRHLDELMDGSGETVLGDVSMSVKNLLQDRLVLHWVGCTMVECEYGNTATPFTMVLPLVRDRKVVISMGNAMVNCSSVQVTLSCVFRKIITTKLDNLKKRGERQPTLVQRVWGGMVEEGNLKSCFAQIFSQFEKQFCIPASGDRIARDKIRADMVDNLAKYFPPCMALLYTKLKKGKKLKHEDRFQLSLFLKDIGLSVEEQIVLWETLYSSQKTRGGNLWSDNRRKYIYGIRHMYGLEGKRVEYNSKTCRRVMEGGRGGDLHCPLVGDVEDIYKYLKRSAKVTDKKAKEVVMMCKEGKVMKACRSLFCCERNFDRPAQLFLVARNSV